METKSENIISYHGSERSCFVEGGFAAVGELVHPRNLAAAVAAVVVETKHSLLVGVAAWEPFDCFPVVAEAVVQRPPWLFGLPSSSL